MGLERENGETRAHERTPREQGLIGRAGQQDGKYDSRRARHRRLRQAGARQQADCTAKGRMQQQSDAGRQQLRQGQRSNGWSGGPHWQKDKRNDQIGQQRKREIVQARQIAMYLSRNLTKTSLSSIGAQLGGKDHATVLHACNTVGDLMDTDRSFRGFVHDIERQLNTPE